MCDIVHYFFEIDSLGTEEEDKAKKGLRSGLYRELYGRAYVWGQAGSSEREFGTQEVGGDSSLRFEHKPYMPPTPFNPEAANPFGSVLDAPLG